MRFIPSVIFAALLTVSLAGVTSAEPPNVSGAVTPDDFARHVGGRLDEEFERAAGLVGAQSLGILSGPSSMDCRYLRVSEGRIDTCVVTAEGIPAIVLPGALAQN
jgi:hypothetical protein